MKKIILFLFLAFSLFSSDAQLRYGFRLGGDFAAARLSGAPEVSVVNRSGFTGGLMLEYQFEKCGFAPDIAVVYARHNSRFKTDDGKPFDSGRNFIDVPLRLKYKFWLKSTHDLFAPMIYTGPVFSFKAGGKESAALPVKTFQPGWDVGLGFDAVNFIQITAGYRFGLGNALKSNAFYPDGKLRTDGWNLTVNILFDF